MRALLSLAWRTTAQIDRASASVARAATVVGQAGLVALGVHLAADRIDDRLLVALQGLASRLDRHLAPPLAWLAGTLGWPTDALWFWTETPWAAAAASGALLVELCALVLLVSTFLLVGREAKASWQGWWAARSIHAVVAPLTLAGAVAAGAWSLGMAVEDAVGGTAGRALGLGLSVLVLARFGLPALRRSVAGLQPTRLRAGIWSAAVLVPIGLLAWSEGTPWAGACHWVQATLMGPR